MQKFRRVFVEENDDDDDDDDAILKICQQKYVILSLLTY